MIVSAWNIFLLLLEDVRRVFPPLFKSLSMDLLFGPMATWPKRVSVFPKKPCYEVLKQLWGGSSASSPDTLLLCWMSGHVVVSFYILCFNLVTEILLESISSVMFALQLSFSFSLSFYLHFCVYFFSFPFSIVNFSFFSNNDCWALDTIQSCVSPSFCFFDLIALGLLHLPGVFILFLFFFNLRLLVLSKTHSCTSNPNAVEFMFQMFKRKYDGFRFCTVVCSRCQIVDFALNFVSLYRPQRRSGPVIEGLLGADPHEKNLAKKMILILIMHAHLTARVCSEKLGVHWTEDVLLAFVSQKKFKALGDLPPCWFLGGFVFFAFCVVFFVVMSDLPPEPRWAGSRITTKSLVQQNQTKTRVGCQLLAQWFHERSFGEDPFHFLGVVQTFRGRLRLCSFQVLVVGLDGVWLGLLGSFQMQVLLRVENKKQKAVICLASRTKIQKFKAWWT